MISNLKKIGSSIKDLFKFQNKLKNQVEELKEQTEDHFHSINENTNEIQSNYEFSLEVDEKINKLAERIDEISMQSSCVQFISSSPMNLIRQSERLVYSLLGVMDG